MRVQFESNGVVWYGTVDTEEAARLKAKEECYETGNVTHVYAIDEDGFCIEDGFSYVAR